jgi:hypothetical protein
MSLFVVCDPLMFKTAVLIVSARQLKMLLSRSQDSLHSPWLESHRAVECEATMLKVGDARLLCLYMIMRLEQLLFLILVSKLVSRRVYRRIRIISSKNAESQIHILP